MANALHKFLILIGLPALSGVLLGVSAIPSNAYWFSFIALIPLLFASDYILSYKKPLLTFTIQLAITLIVFYLSLGWWILQITNMSFLLGLTVVLPFLLLVPLYILFKKKEHILAPLFFIATWITAEMIQSYFELGSPFFNLGYNLGANPELIQWYEFTGATGGTLWILSVNFLIYSFLKKLNTGRKQLIQKSAVLTAVLFLPIIISTLIYHNYKEKGYSSEILVIHPSVNNYNEKFKVNIYDLMDIYLDVMLPEISENTDYVILPETAITNAGWVKNLNRNLVFNHFHEHTDSFPNLKLITGAVTYEEISNVKKIKNYEKIPGIRYSKKHKTWYYTYNAALHIEKKQPVQMRVKEGLMPYQEYAPYPTIVPRLTPVGIDFQFSKRKVNRSVFEAANNIKTTAFICYEVVFNRLFFDAVRKGTQAFFIILNEGWYENSDVPQQVLQHSIIRAIETRRGIAHASNSGISAIIDQRGDVIAETDSKKADFLKNEIKMNRKVTIAARLGNYIELLALLTSVSFFIYNLFYFFKKTRYKR